MKRPEVDLKGLYTVHEACTLLGISRRTLKRYLDYGAIEHHVRKADHRIVFYGADLLKCYTTTI